MNYREPLGEIRKVVLRRPADIREPRETALPKIEPLHRDTTHSAGEIFASRGQSSPMDENRPKIVPISYGASPYRYEGLLMSNEGTPAYDVVIEEINLDGAWRMRFDSVSYLGKNGISRSWISAGNGGITTLDGVWRDLKEHKPVLPLIITYKDSDRRSYRSQCELHRDVRKKSGFDVKFIKQERIHPPESLSHAPLLSYEGIESGGAYRFNQRMFNAQVAKIRNRQVAVKNTADKVTASIEYKDRDGGSFCIQRGFWIDDGRLSPTANLSGNEVQRIVILLVAEDGALYACLDSGVAHELDVGHWTLRINIMGENCEPLILTGGFTRLSTATESDLRTTRRRFVHYEPWRHLRRTSEGLRDVWVSTVELLRAPFALPLIAPWRGDSIPHAICYR